MRLITRESLKYDLENQAGIHTVTLECNMEEYDFWDIYDEDISIYDKQGNSISLAKLNENDKLSLIEWVNERPWSEWYMEHCQDEADGRDDDRYESQKDSQILD